MGIGAVSNTANTFPSVLIAVPGSSGSQATIVAGFPMAQKGEANTLMYFINTTFNYPTLAEAYRVAALNGLNRIQQ